MNKMKKIINYMFHRRKSNTRYRMADMAWMESTYNEKLKYWLFVNINNTNPMKRDDFINTVVSETIQALSIDYLSDLNKYFGPYKLQEKLEQRVFIIYEENRITFDENKKLLNGGE